MEEKLTGFAWVCCTSSSRELLSTVSCALAEREIPSKTATVPNKLVRRNIIIPPCDGYSRDLAMVTHVTLRILACAGDCFAESIAGTNRQNGRSLRVPSTVHSQLPTFILAAIVVRDSTAPA